MINLHDQFLEDHKVISKVISQYPLTCTFLFDHPPLIVANMVMLLSLNRIVPLYFSFPITHTISHPSGSPVSYKINIQNSSTRRSLIISSMLHSSH